MTCHHGGWNFLVSTSGHPSCLLLIMLSSQVIFTDVIWLQLEKVLWLTDHLKTLSKPLFVSTSGKSSTQNWELIAVSSFNYCFRMSLLHNPVIMPASLVVHVTLWGPEIIRAWYKMFLKWQRFFLVCLFFVFVFVFFLFFVWVVSLKKKKKLCRIESI